VAFSIDILILLAAYVKIISGIFLNVKLWLRDRKMKKIGTFVPKNEILDKNVFYKYETEEQRKIKFENEKK
jgi:hypothetical protein